MSHRSCFSTLGAAVIAGFTLLASAHGALAEKRVALIVGNSTYQTVPQLPNPSRDANSVAQMFRDAGFETVDVQLDVGNLEFKRSIRKFEIAADAADIAVVYYAGHGIEIGGTNYLIPTDARLASDRDADDEAIPLERLVASADGARKLRIVILDACRDNPFATTMRRERKMASRAVSAGLSKVEPTSTDTLIAYAAKAGSTAEDGDGKNSPFTAAILKNLTVPGLDIRLAFGRIRDEVMKSTRNRQEPFVYGSLGGGNISLVPAPVTAPEAPAGDIKADYDLVAKIGSRRAWEVFLNTYKTGFYADLARAQVASLTDQVPTPSPAAAPSGVVVASAPVPAPTGQEQNSREDLDYDRVKNSTDLEALRRFVKKYPDSPRAITVQQRLEVLQAAQQERDDRARAEREAAQKAAEEARIAAAQRRAQEAAERKRDEDQRRAVAAEAEQKAKAAAAERRAAEAKQRAEEAERTKAAAESARLRAESEKQARQAEEERRKAELASAQEAACQQQQGTFNDLNAKAGDDEGLAALKSFAKSNSCERLKPQIVAAIDRFETEAKKRAAAQPNSPELVRAAQVQLARVGCFAAKPDGVVAGSTRVALGRFYTTQNQSEPAADAPITEQLVADLGKPSGRICPLECKSNEIIKGDACIAAKAAPATASRRERDDDEPVRARKPAPRRQAERETARPARAAAAPAPRARQQAASRPSGGGGGSTMIGVGF